MFYQIDTQSGQGHSLIHVSPDEFFVNFYIFTIDRDCVFHSGSVFESRRVLFNVADGSDCYLTFVISHQMEEP